MNATTKHPMRSKTIRIVAHSISLDQVKALEAAGYRVVMVIKGARPNKVSR